MPTIQKKPNECLLLASVALSLTAWAPAARAESSVGFDAAGRGSVSASARVRITVQLPQVVMLRLGTPGPEPAHIVIDANVPDRPPQGVRLEAQLWHNSASGVSLACAVSQAFAHTLTARDLIVLDGGGSLPHPGPDTRCGQPVSGLSRNTLHQNQWTYSLRQPPSPGVGGAVSEVVTYTVSSP